LLVLLLENFVINYWCNLLTLLEDVTIDFYCNLCNLLMLLETFIIIFKSTINRIYIDDNVEFEQPWI
jgi:protein associated with RNAse G/E